jgi:hypothetical protein
MGGGGGGGGGGVGGGGGGGGGGGYKCKEKYHVVIKIQRKKIVLWFMSMWFIYIKH